MLIRKKLDPNDHITLEELEMLEAAEKIPIVFDEDSPELTREQLKQFRCVSDIDPEERKR